VSFSLPKTSLEVLEETLSSLNVDLIERSVDRYSLNFSIGFPEALLSHMKIFADGISTSVPPANPFGESKMQGVIGEWEGDVEHAQEVVAVHRAVKLVVDSGDNWNIKVVSREDLVRLVYKSLSFRQVLRLRQVVFDLAHVDLGHPRIRVDYGHQNFLDWDFVGDEILLFELLDTPRHIASLSSLLVLPQKVAGVAQNQKLVLMLFDEPLRLEIGVIFMRLHGQKDHVVGPGPLVDGYLIDGLAEQLLVLLVAGYDKSVVNLPAIGIIIKILHHFVPLHKLGPVEYSPGLEVRGDGDEEEKDGLDGEM